MNRRTIHQGDPRPRRIGGGAGGFALVLTISLLALIVLLMAALATLTRVETTVAARAGRMAVARHHARLGLDLAIGQLQAYVGPDSRVTATAESVGGTAGTRFHTGVWDVADSSAEPMTWLVSGNEGADPRAVRPGLPVIKPVELVGAGSGPARGEVIVPAQPVFADDVPALEEPRLVGRYAWWVGDQGVKASVRSPREIEAASYPPFDAAEARLVLAQQTAVDPQLDGVDVRLPQNARRLRHATSQAQLAWIDSEGGDPLGIEARVRFHDWAMEAAAVLASTAADADPERTGLRRDLSLRPEELGPAFAAQADFSAYLETPGATAGDFPPEPPIGPESPRRRYRITPPVSAKGLAHAVAPVLTMFLLQFNIRTLDGSPSSAEFEVRARMVLSLWNPYTSALVPEELGIEVDGLPVVIVQDSNGGRTALALQDLFGDGDTMRIRLTPLEANPAFRGSPDDLSWLPGRVYYWRTRGGNAGSGWETEFYNRTLSVANANTWMVPTGQAHAGEADGDVTFSIEIPPATLSLRLVRGSDGALLATYTSPTFEAPAPVPPYRDNEYRFGFPFRLVESFDTVLADPGLWLTTEGGGFRDPAPPAGIFRPFASGGNDPTLYVGMVTVSAPERLLDRVMGTTGMSYNEDVPLFELPRQPGVSLGALQHLAVAGRRPFTIGNPWGAEGGWNGIFDCYFLSGLAAGVHPRLDVGEPLPNTALRFLRVHPDGGEVTLDDLLVQAGSGFTSKHLLQTCAFNVNSVRVEAWRAILGSIRYPIAAPWRHVASTTTTGTTAGDEEPAWLAVPHAAFLRFPQSAQETYRATATTNPPATFLFRRGLRSLSAAEWNALAAAVAARVREKHAASGPFRTLAEFLGPLEEATFGGRSVLEAAIEDAELNRNVGEFSSQWLTQGDLMTALAPRLFARSDTFLVRAYGEAVNAATRESVATAWCEAVMQRYPDPLEPAMPGSPTDAEYHHPPGPYGRAFRIVSFRWLSPSIFDLDRPRRGPAGCAWGGAAGDVQARGSGGVLLLRHAIPVGAACVCGPAGEAPTVVTLYRAGRSPRYEYIGPMPIRFFAGAHSPASGSLPADGALRVLAEAQVPVGMTEALVLLAPNAEARERSDEPPFQVLVLDDSAATFPPGCVRVCNAAGHRLVARIGRQEHVLPAGPGPVIPADASVEIALRLQAGSRWHESYRGTLNLGGAGRCLLIILPPRYRGSPEVEVRVLRDEVKIPDDDPRG